MKNQEQIQRKAVQRKAAMKLAWYLKKEAKRDFNRGKCRVMSHTESFGYYLRKAWKAVKEWISQEADKVVISYEKPGLSLNGGAPFMEEFKTRITFPNIEYYL